MPQAIPACLPKCNGGMVPATLKGHFDGLSSFGYNIGTTDGSLFLLKEVG